MLSGMAYLCQLQYAAGRVGACPEDGRCPFWDDDRCALAGLRPDWPRNAALAAHLLELRSRLLMQEPDSLFGLLPRGNDTQGRPT
jgi:hypothetical protein